MSSKTQAKGGDAGVRRAEIWCIVPRPSALVLARQLTERRRGLRTMPLRIEEPPPSPIRKASGVGRVNITLISAKVSVDSMFNPNP